LKGLEKVVALKERELKRKQEELNLLTARERALRLEIERVEGEISSLKVLNPESVLQFALTREVLGELLRKREGLRRELKELSEEIEEKREELGKLRGEVNLIKELLRKRKLREERVEEVLNERFIYQVLYGRSSG